MDILLLAGNGPIDFSPGLPEYYKGKILHVPGAKSATALNGDLIVQDYANTHYNIRYSICRFLQRLSIQRLCQHPGLYARIVLEGDVQHRIHTIGKVRLKKNQYILVKADRGECVTHFERHRHYNTWIFSFPMTWWNRSLTSIRSCVNYCLTLINPSCDSVVPKASLIFLSSYSLNNFLILPLNPCSVNSTSMIVPVNY